jgi:hypothetical protein
MHHQQPGYGLYEHELLSLAMQQAASGTAGHTAGAISSSSLLQN